MGEQVQKQEQQTQAPERRQMPRFIPDVDIKETEDAFEILADMPGVNEQNVNVDIEKNTLTISGEIQVQEPEGYQAEYREYMSGHYERSFTVGNEIDRSGVKATVNNGVLRLHLPKAKEAQPRRIPVTRED